MTHLFKLKLAFEFFHFRGPLVAEVSAISKSSITVSCAAVNGAWSGLSESNRHLNLGKVPYYHYTKAAQQHSFYSMPGRQGQASPVNACLKQNGQRTKMLRKLG